MLPLLYECNDFDGMRCHSSRNDVTCPRDLLKRPGRTSSVARRCLPVSGGHVTSDELPWSNIWHVPLKNTGTDRIGVKRAIEEVAR